MKKIKTISQLKAAKKDIKGRQLELEKAIKYDWRDFKETLQPKNVAGQVFSKFFQEKQSANVFIADNVSQIFAGFVSKWMEKLGVKLGKWFKK